MRRPPEPIPGHDTRKCQARLTGWKAGRRCHAFHMKDRLFCWFHGGCRRTREGRDIVRISHLPRFYSRQLGKTLHEAVEEHLSAAPEEQINLFEELALTRVIAGDAVALYSATCEALKDKPADDKQAHAAKDLAGSIVIDAMKHVSDVCTKAAQIEAQAKDKFSVHSVTHVVNQIIRVMYELCEPEHHDIAVKFEHAVRTQVKLPRITTDGTELTPDEDAVAMDATVPKAPDTGTEPAFMQEPSDD